MAEHVLEPELASPPPRPVRARGGWNYGCGLWCVRLFILPHTIGGVFLACQAVSAILLYFAVLIAGTEVDGHLVKKTETVTKKQTRHWLDYAFTLNGREYTARQDADEETFARLA